jgi:hypothetical protein
MPFRATAVACTVLASAALAGASFLSAPAAHAAARPAAQPGGKQLLSALLPPSAFGPDFERTAWFYLGKTGVVNHVAKMSCASFEDGVGLGLFGETAAANSFTDNQNPWPAYPNAEFYYWQTVYQFASAKAATSFYNQAHAKYGACRDFTEPVPPSSVPGSGSMETVTQSVSSASLGKIPTFEVAQSSDLSESSGFSILLNTRVAVAGPDVFIVQSVGGTNDAIPDNLMTKLINRVKRLR